MTSVTARTNGRLAAAGFTLVELMIVVAIIGILAAIAMPVYKNYTIHARMTEIIALMGRDRTQLANFRGETGKWPTAAAILAGDPRISAAVDSPYLTADTTVTAVNAGADVMLTYSVDVRGVSGTMTMTSQSNVATATWTCGSVGISQEFLPKNCR